MRPPSRLAQSEAPRAVPHAAVGGQSAGEHQSVVESPADRETSARHGRRDAGRPLQLSVRPTRRIVASAITPCSVSAGASRISTARGDRIAVSASRASARVGYTIRADPAPSVASGCWWCGNHFSQSHSTPHRPRRRSTTAPGEWEPPVDRSSRGANCAPVPCHRRSSPSALRSAQSRSAPRRRSACAGIGAAR